MIIVSGDGVGVSPLRRWRLDHAEFSYDAVLRTYQRTGRHSVPLPLHTELDRVRALTPPATPLRTFLDIALDKYDGTFDYNSYLALELLPLPEPADDVPTARLRHDRLMAALVRDLMVFETEAAEGATPVLPEHRPPMSLVLKRMRHGNTRLMALPERPVLDSAERWALRCSMMPVGRAHDEYLFIRALQAFETSLALIAVELSAALDAPDVAGAHFEAAESALRELAPLSAALATVRPVSLRDFRRYAQGASAGQSRGYRRVESLCRVAPDSPLIGRMRGFRVALARWQTLFWHVQRSLGYPLGEPGR